MPKRRRASDDFDSPWKEALHAYFPNFLAFFFPDIHADIDWSRGYEALDKEFQQIVREAKQGKHLADKLFKVWLRGGGEFWLFIHVEVQGQPDPDFPERMFDYNVAVRRLYNQTVISLAVLCDDRPNWRPTTFRYGKWDSYVELKFRVVKLLDYREDTSALENNDNPFVCIVLAHLRAIDTQKDPANRARRKLQLVKGLYRANWSKDDVRQLFRLIDWIMSLPVELEELFRAKVHQFEEERKMPYLTSIERLALDEGLKKGLEQGREKGLEQGREQGREQGLREGLLESIDLDLTENFGRPTRKLLEQIHAISDIARLRRFARFLKKAKTLEEVREHLS
jgi:predicted transposase/invertase (TIGR01784 family)